MAMDLKEIESLIKEAMPDASIEIQDLAGDGNHYSATVTSSEFSGKSKIEQHKMVYNSLKGKMGNERGFCPIWRDSSPNENHHGRHRRTLAKREAGR